MYFLARHLTEEVLKSWADPLLDSAGNVLVVEISIRETLGTNHFLHAAKIVTFLQIYELFLNWQTYYTYDF